MVIYTHRVSDQWLVRLAREKIHRGSAIEVRAIDAALVDAVVARLERRMGFTLSVTDGDLVLSFSDDTLSGAVSRLSLM